MDADALTAIVQALSAMNTRFATLESVVYELRDAAQNRRSPPAEEGNPSGSDGGVGVVDHPRGENDETLAAATLPGRLDAPGTAPNSRFTLQAINMPTLIVTSSITLFTAGMHFGWTMPSLKKIMSAEYPFTVTQDEASYIAIVSSVGHVIGGIAGPTFTDIVGRKRTLLAISIPQVCGWMMIYFSYYGTYLLYGARIAGGIGEGASLSVVAMYVGEVVEPSIRGTVGLVCSLAFPIGSLFMNVLGSYLDIRTMALTSLIFPILLWLTFTSMPESPYYFLMKGNYHKAEDSLQLLRRDENVDRELFILEKDVARQMSEPGRFRDLFAIDSNRKALVLMVFARIFQQFTGCAAFGIYSQLLVEKATTMSPVFGSSVIILLNIFVNMSAGLFIDKVGRKKLLSLSAAGTCFALFLLGTFFLLKDYLGMDLSSFSWLPLLFLLMFWVTFSFGVGSVTIVLMSEFFSASIKTKAFSTCSIVYAGCLMTTTKYYQYGADYYSLAVPFYTFAGFTLIGIFFYHFILPESRGKSLEMIQQELKGIKQPKNVENKI